MSLPLYQVDAFTAEAFRGNPAAVCVLPHEAPESWMQQLAAEMNLSETSFLYPVADHWLLRWFTPLVEVDLCGHATLAAAHALWEFGHASPQSSIEFETRSGRLTAARNESWIELDFPAIEHAVMPPDEQLTAALRSEPLAWYHTDHDLLLELASAADVRRLSPDFSRLKQFNTRGIIVTAEADRPGIDFVSRFFAPRVGINEDPVTGSAHCALAPFWAPRLGRNQLVGLQISSRQGEVRMKLADARVQLSGQAVTILRGELSLPACPPKN